MRIYRVTWTGSQGYKNELSETFSSYILIYIQAEDLEPAMDPQNALKVDVGKSKV